MIQSASGGEAQKTTKTKEKLEIQCDPLTIWAYHIEQILSGK